MNFIAPLAAHWKTISVREQRLLMAALALLVGAALWWLALAPALATLRSAPAQHLLQDAQLQTMQRLQAQAQLLQAQPPLSPGESRRLLEATVKDLGANAQLNVLGERATITLKGASAAALAQCLAQARLNARTLPTKAHLVRNAAGTWDGTLVLTLR
jgi:general secretion pathway protein M